MSAEPVNINEPMRDPRAARYIPVSILRINPSAQRPVDMDRVARIAANWDYAKAEAVTVVINQDGTIDVVEGQNRVLALKSVDPSATILCVILLGSLTNAEQAGVALSIGKGRRAISALDAHKMAITNGDEVHVAVHALLSEKGIRVSKTATPRSTQAISAILSIAKSGHGRGDLDENLDMLERVLNVITAAWPMDPASGRDERFTGDIIRVVADVLEMGHQDKDVAKSLKKENAESWLKVGKGGSRRFLMRKQLVNYLPQIQKG